MTSPLDIAAMAPRLLHVSEGHWCAPETAEISYPAHANDLCFSVEDRSFWFQHRNRCIGAVVGSLPPPGALFDVGGGNGVVAAALARSGVETVLVEPGPQGIQHARSRGIGTRIQATLETAGFRPGVLPGCGLFDVLEHVEDDLAFLQLVRSRLQDDGRLYLTVPAFQALWSDEDRDAGHFRRYNAPALRAVLRRAGFEVEYISYFFAALTIPVAAFRALPGRLGLRRGVRVAQQQRELAPDDTMTLRLLRSALEPEVRRLRALRPVPIGASCIAVARPLASTPEATPRVGVKR